MTCSVRALRVLFAVLAGGLVTLSLAAPTATADEEEVAVVEAPSEIPKERDYRYFDREDLFREREKWVGTGATVTDYFMKIWDHQEDLEDDGYLKFDTRYFRCAVEKGSASAEYVKYLAQLTDDGRSNKRLITLWGLVDRPEFWGKVVNSGEGVDTETVWIVLDQVTKPRERFYLDIDLDDRW